MQCVHLQLAAVVDPSCGPSGALHTWACKLPGKLAQVLDHPNCSPQGLQYTYVPLRPQGLWSVH